MVLACWTWITVTWLYGCFSLVDLIYSELCILCSSIVWFWFSQFTSYNSFYGISCPHLALLKKPPFTPDLWRMWDPLTAMITSTISLVSLELLKLQRLQHWTLSCMARRAITSRVSHRESVFSPVAFLTGWEGSIWWCGDERGVAWGAMQTPRQLFGTV